MSSHIVVAGHLCLDITPGFPPGKARDFGSLLTPGTLLSMERGSVHCGGSVGNTGLALQVLGANVSLMGMVGADYFGQVVSQIIESYGAENALLVSDLEGSSYTVALAPPGIDRVFLHYPGVNDCFTVDDLDFSRIARADLFHYGYPSLMKGFSGRNAAALPEMYRRVKELGLVTSLDMAMVDPDTEAAGTDWPALIQGAMPYTDLFLPSIEELLSMLDPDRYTQLANRGDVIALMDLERDVRPLADMLIAWGANIVLIKCGARGMYLQTAAAQALSSIGKRLGLDLSSWDAVSHFESSYLPDRFASTAAAGDTSIAAFLHALTGGRSWQDCVRLAAATGACCVASYGALDGLLPFDALDEKIRRGWPKVPPVSLEPC